MIPRVHWPSVRGRARADAGPLLLAGVVLMVVTLLATAAPPLLRATADDAVRDAVRRAGPTADVLTHARWIPDDAPGGGRTRVPDLAEDVDEFRRRAENALTPDLRRVLRPPTTIVSSPTLRITDGSQLRTFQLNYLADARGAASATAVTWVAGGPPRPSVTRDATMSYDAPPWPVQVGLSEADAAALGVGPGDRIPLVDEQKREKHVEVSGVFRPDDGPGWRLAPWLLHPVSGSDGVGTTRLGGLLSPDSLPDARLAFDQDELDRTVRFAPDPSTLTADSGRTIAGTVVELKVTSGSSATLDASLKWESRLDLILREVQTRVDAAAAQASVLLLAVVAGTVLVLLLAADLLVRRRTPSLTITRRRGAAVGDLALELTLESVLVAALFAAVGLALARLVTPDVAWWWAVPVAATLAAASPGFGTLATARATSDRRVPANRSARRFIHRTAELRRAALEVALLAAATAAAVALHQRGILPTPTDAAAPAAGGLLASGGGVLPASAPALGAVAGAVLLLRVLPAGLGVALAWALRARRPLLLFGTARAAATAGRALPVLAMVAAAALASFALTLDATANRGLAAGAWQTVGADARLDLAPDAAEPAVPELARTLAARPGVRQVVTAQVTDDARVLTGQTLVTPRLVIVDSAAFRRLLASTPLPDAPALSLLAAAGSADVPALVRSADGGLRPGMRLELPREGADPVPLRTVGTAPRVGDVEDVVIVDARALAERGVPVVPDTVWVVGPGTAKAVAAADVPADVVLRATVLHDRRSAPLTAGLLRLTLTSAAVLLVAGLLGLALGAAAGAPDRWQTLSRLRTLGLRVRDARRVAAGELLPPVAVAAVGGPLLGLLLARLTLGPLSVRVLTGQPSDPPLVVPWWGLAAVAVALLVAVAVVVPVESALRRRRGLAEVLRAGG
ncbi:FtsX-like permease family protein [Virgisporangium aurantiacum]|uniref:ABC3 transporter permease C-terminal domain-containing protein n=1 Tax=Virgisporangium aurantiacum TaxID=175570 RepID=A0A8J3ZBF6_9ACTN|nr:FtsX-like permease family protein [Virgisporangium aurantiacum]GIJ60722.1 hypothetical protein Vau01_082380 [Virgisporangium aurantiacum]